MHWAINMSGEYRRFHWFFKSISWSGAGEEPVEACCLRRAHVVLKTEMFFISGASICLLLRGFAQANEDSNATFLLPLHLSLFKLHHWAQNFSPFNSKSSQKSDQLNLSSNTYRDNEATNYLDRFFAQFPPPRHLFAASQSDFFASIRVRFAFINGRPSHNSSLTVKYDSSNIFPLPLVCISCRSNKF